MTTEEELTVKTFRAITVNRVLVRVFMDLNDQSNQILLYTEGPSEDKTGLLQMVEYQSWYQHEDEHTDTGGLIWQIIPIEKIGKILQCWAQEDCRNMARWKQNEQLVISKKHYLPGLVLGSTNIIPASLYLDFGRLQEKLLRAKPKGMENQVVIKTFRRRLEGFLTDEIRKTEESTRRIAALNLV